MKSAKVSHLWPVVAWVASFFVALVAGSFGTTAWAVDTTWIFNGDGNWTTAANWSNGEPTNNTFNVFIDDGDSAVTVTLDANRTVATLAIGSDDKLLFADTDDLRVDGATVVNNGMIALNAAGVLNQNTDFTVGGAQLTLSGSGTLSLGGAFQNRVLGSLATNELINGSSHTIAGGGQLGTNLLKLTNQGLIDANINAATLFIDPSGSNATNTGTMRATNGGILQVLAGVFTNTGGTIRAQGAGSVVQLNGANNGLSIIGGTLSTDASGLIETAGGTTPLQDVTLAGTLRVRNDEGIELRGTFNNQGGKINVDGGGNNTDIQIEGDVLLTGGGEIHMIGQFSRILDEFNPATGLLNNSDNYIHGRGQIGGDGGRMLFTNGGVIEADAGAVAGPLSIRGRSGDPVHPGVINTATGVFRASNNSTLNLSGTGDGTFTNEGTFESIGDGSFIITNNSAVINSLSGGVLTEGTYRVVSNDGNVGLTTILFNAPNGVISEIGTDATVELSGDATKTNFSSGTQHIRLSLTTNSGNLKLFNGQDFVMTHQLTNSGTVELGGAGLAGGKLTSAGDIINAAGGEIGGHGTIHNRVLNSGTVRAYAGPLFLDAPIDGQSGTIQVDPDGALDLTATGGDSDTDFLIHNGSAFGSLNLGSHNIVVRVDYNNANFGVGNSFNPRANVLGSGEILADPAVLQQLSGDVANGATATASMDLGNIRVGDSVTKSYQVNNVAVSGPNLRGAIQTNNAMGNGGNLTDPQLTGAGVTASNYGPLAAGAATGNLGVTFTGMTAGLLSGQQVAVVNNFDNVAGQVLQFTGAAYNPAVADVTPTTVNFGNFHVGDSVTPQAIAIANTAPAGAFSEDLLANNFVATPDAFIVGGSPSSVQVLAGGSNNALHVGFSTAAAGARTGSIAMDLTSTGEVNGVAILGLGTLGLGQANVDFSANVYRYAAPVVNSLALGDFHVGDLAQGNVNVQNTQINDGFSESVRVATDSFAPDVLAATGTTDVAPGANSGAGLSASISTAMAGVKSGTVTYNLTSLAAAAGLNDTVLAQQQATVTATVYRYAAPTVNNLSLGDFHVGDLAQGNINVQNTAVADGFSESLRASVGGFAPSVTAAAGMADIGPASSNSAAFSATLSTAAAGAISGTVDFDLTSLAATANLSNTALAQQQSTVHASVYNLAQPQILNPQPINFGIVHVGDAPMMGLNIKNNAPGGSFSEYLNAATGALGPGVTGSGSFNGLAAQTADNGSLQVGIDTSAAAVINSTYGVDFVSDGTGINSLGQTALASQNVAVNAQVNNYAVAQPQKLSGDGIFSMTGANEYKLDLGTIQQNAGNLSAVLGILNDVLAPADQLEGDFTLSAPDFLLSGFSSFMALAPGSTHGGLMIGLDSATVGTFSGQIVLHPQSTNPQPFSAPLPDVTVNLMGEVAPVPEPTSALLALLGIAAALAGRRDR